MHTSATSMPAISCTATIIIPANHTYTLQLIDRHVAFRNKECPYISTYLYRINLDLRPLLSLIRSALKYIYTYILLYILWECDLLLISLLGSVSLRRIHLSLRGKNIIIHFVHHPYKDKQIYTSTFSNSTYGGIILSSLWKFK